MKRILSACAALLLVLALVPALPASAAGKDYLTAALAVDSEGNPLGLSPAVPFELDGQIAVLADINLKVSGAAAIVVSLDGELVPMQYINDADAGMALFAAETSGASQVLRPASSVQVGESLTYCFFLDDGNEMPLMDCPAVLSEDGSGGYSVNRDIPQGVDANQIMYPAILLNQSGELVAVNGKNGYLTFAQISGGGGGGSTPAPTEPATPQPDDPTSKPDDPISRDDPKPDDEDEDELPVTLIVGIGAAVVAAVVLGVVLSRRKGGAQQMNQVQPGLPIQPMGPVAPTSPVSPTGPAEPEVPPYMEGLGPVVPERIEPVVIDPQPQPKSSVLYLCCEGGALDGRRYPMSGTSLLIGRDPSCNICYPADTKGVSRRHCQIFWKNGVLHIMDLGSTSGTFIRGKGQIAANAPVPVNAGDTFYLGEKRNAFVIRMGD